MKTLDELCGIGKLMSPPQKVLHSMKMLNFLHISHCLGI